MVIDERVLELALRTNHDVAYVCLRLPCFQLQAFDSAEVRFVACNKR